MGAESNARVVLLEHIRARGILRAEEQRLISRTGKPNRWLLDLRLVLMSAEALDAAATVFWEMFGDLYPFQVGGMEMAAIPLVCAIMMRSVSRGTPVSGFIVRKERKTSGAGNRVEGEITGLPIVVVDDLMNSAKSLEKVFAVLEDEGKRCRAVFVLVDFYSSAGEAWRKLHEVDVRCAVGLEELGLDSHRTEQAPVLGRLRPVWKFVSPDPNFFYRVPKSFPQVHAGKVYFGSDCGVFWCLDAQTGDVKWQHRVQARGHKNLWSTAAVEAGRVYFGAYDGNVYCLDADSGREQWRFEGADWVGSSPALAVELGLLFVGLEFATPGKHGSIVALDLASGEKVWERGTPEYTHGSPAYSAVRGVVACGSNGGELFLLRARTGELVWTFETRGAKTGRGAVKHAPAFYERLGQVVVGSMDGAIYVLDVETGAEVWSVQTDNSVYTVPLVLGDRAIVGSTDKYLYVLDLEKRCVAQKLYLGAKIYSPARLLAGRVYVGSWSGMIYELDAETLQITATHQLPDAVTNALAFDEATSQLFALTYVNELFALRRTAGAGMRDQAGSRK